MKQRLAFIFLILSSQLLLAYTPISDDRLKELLEGFNYTPAVQIMKLPKAGCIAQDLEFTTTYPQREGSLSIRAKTFIPTLPNVPVVFMLPPMGGMNQLDQGMGEVFCRHNIAAIIITTNLTGLDSATLVPVSDHDHTHRRVASAIKGGILVVHSLNSELNSSGFGINTAKIGLFGASLGGILGSVAYGVIPQISAATFLVNGGDVPYILAHSDQKEIVKVRNARMQQQGLKSIEEYETYLQQNLDLDPLHFAKLIDRESTKLYLSKADKTVPSEKQMEYYKAIKTPVETSFYSLGHVPTIVSVMGINSNKTKIAQWFKMRFAKPNPRKKSLRVF